MDVVDTQYVYSFVKEQNYETLKEASLSGRYVDRRTFQFVAKPKPDDFSGKWGVGKSTYIDAFGVTFHGLNTVNWGERSMNNCLQKVKLGFVDDLDYVERAFYDEENFSQCVYPSDGITTTTGGRERDEDTGNGTFKEVNDGSATVTEFLNAPEIRSYIGIFDDANFGHGPHAADGAPLSNGGYVATGISTKTEGGAVGQGWVGRVDPCTNAGSYENKLGTFLNGAGNNCAQNFKWVWKHDSGGKHTHMVSVKESPDRTFVLAAAYNGYVAKIDINTGELIWDFDFKTSSGTRSGFETIHFTSDGGFIVGGFSHRADVEMPGFKSGGQVDQGRPVMHKFSAQVASSASVSNPSPVWTYRCGSGSNSCALDDGSVKNMRVFNDNGVEKVVGLPTSRSIFIVLRTNNGNELIYSGNAINNGFIGDGTANDVEVQFNDAGTSVTGFVTTGLRVTKIQNDNGVSCAAQEDGCSVIKGVFTKYNAGLTKMIWRQAFNTGVWPGGAAQFSSVSATPYESLVYTECWGLTKVLSTAGGHVGYAAACGSGVEPGCEIHSGAIKTACQNDARTAWRGAVTRIDREGNLVWYRLDSFQGDSNDAGESASEYIFQDNDGRIVSVTDEGFGGFGFLTYEGA
ncbi:unnamed protein product [Oikopleura dioica]|uniref:Oikosin 17b n=1 Tax=Oikopleura dioica TaxID=34765 RepID=E4X1I3_OIKDI|nr:unnamed protein product [Oikopleura dioica]CCG47850.1 oikosin 17b [Oikopleura dioica]